MRVCRYGYICYSIISAYTILLIGYGKGVSDICIYVRNSIGLVL